MSGNFFDEPAEAVVLPPEPFTIEPPRRNYAVAALHNGLRGVATGRQPLWRTTKIISRFLSDGSLTESEIRDCMVAASRAAGIPIREACLTIDSAIRAKRR